MKPTRFELLTQRSKREKLSFARELRERMTPAERAFWVCVRRGRWGVRFRRQMVVAGYVVDFYCVDLGLVVEIDGLIHAKQRAYDRRRDAAMERRGLRVVRLTNAEVLANADGALERAVRGAA